MELRISWLRVVCAGALAVGVASMPLTASAQEKGKAPAKKHKINHAKKTHRRPAHRTVKHVAIIKERVPVQVEKVVPPPPIVPAGPVAGTVYDETTWRGFHADWNGQYHYHDGKYYYDEEFKFPGQIPNDFNSIVGRFGGAATLEGDPTLVFDGESGEPYPVLEYNSDRYKSDKKLKLKSAFFGRPYFWRDGVRYDRKLIENDKGVRCFQFVKHS